MTGMVPAQQKEDDCRGRVIQYISLMLLTDRVGQEKGCRRLLIYRSASGYNCCCSGSLSGRGYVSPGRPKTSGTAAVKRHVGFFAEGSGQMFRRCFNAVIVGRETCGSGNAIFSLFIVTFLLNPFHSCAKKLKPFTVKGFNGP